MRFVEVVEPLGLGALALLVHDFGAELLLEVGVDREEDHVPGETADGDVKVGEEDFVESLENVLTGDDTGVNLVVEVDDGLTHTRVERLLVHAVVEVGPLALELAEEAHGVGGEDLGPGETMDAAIDHDLKELLTVGHDAHELVLVGLVEFTVDDLGDDKEGQQLEVFDGVEHAVLGRLLLGELGEVLLDNLLNGGSLRDNGGLQEGLLGDSTESPPALVADETDAVAKDLHHEPAGVVAGGLGMTVGIFKDALDVLRLGQDTAPLSDLICQRRTSREFNIHFRVHSRPDTIDITKLLVPLGAVLVTLEQLRNVALPVRPFVVGAGNFFTCLLAFDRKSNAQILIYNESKDPVPEVIQDRNTQNNKRSSSQERRAKARAFRGRGRHDGKRIERKKEIVWCLEASLLAISLDFYMLYTLPASSAARSGSTGSHAERQPNTCETRALTPAPALRLMSKRWRLGQNRRNCRARQHPLGPRPQVWPPREVDSNKVAHDGHTERQVRQVGDRRPVRERDVLLAWQRETLIQDIPLLQPVGVKPDVW